MWSISQFLFFLLCFKALNISSSKSNIIKQLEKDQYDMVNLEFNNNYVSYSIHESNAPEDYKIYLKEYTTHSNNVGEKIGINTYIYPLYYFINCIFAEYMHDALITLVNCKKEYDDSQCSCYDVISYINDNVDKLKGYTNNILNAFLRFLKKNSYRRIDMDFIKTLISLNIKFYKLNTESFETSFKEFNKILNEIQKFVIFNCQLPSNYNSYLIENFFINQTNCRQRKKAKSNYYNNFIENEMKEYRNEIMTYYNGEECNIYRALLADLRNLNKDAFLSNKLNNIFIVFTCNECPRDTLTNISLRYLLNTVLENYDVDIIFCYMRIVFNAILILIIDETNVMLNDINNYKSTIHLYRGILFLLSDLTNLPRELIDLFELLSINPSKIKHDAFIKYRNNILTFDIVDNVKRGTDIKDIKATLKFRNTTGNEENFLEHIYYNILKYECFFQYFEFLSYEYKRYTPRTKTKQIVYTFIVKNLHNYHNMNESNEIFIPNLKITKVMFSMKNSCINTIKYIDKISNDTNIEQSKKSTFLNNINKNLDRIMFDITKLTKVKGYSSYNETAYIIESIKNTKDIFFKKCNYDDIKRIIFAVVNELNMFGIEIHPNDHKKNFKKNILQLVTPSLFNKQRKGLVNYDNDMSFFENDLVDHKLITDDERVEMQLPNFTDLYHAYESNKENFKLYNTIILLGWNGKKKTIEDIFLSTAEVILNPKIHFALFDVFFTFSISVICYEIMRGNESLTDYNKLTQLINSFPLIYQSSIQLCTAENFVNINDMVNEINKLNRISIYVDENTDTPPKACKKFIEDLHSYLSKITTCVDLFENYFQIPYNIV